MKKMIRFPIILLAILLITVAVQAQLGSQPHPNPYSGDLANYEGTWIIDGKTEQDSNWTLEISGDKYHLHNEHQDFKGDIIFTPGSEKFDTPDTLWLDFDPDLRIEVVLINLAGGLIDISGQGLYFVRPGNRIDFDEAEVLENYSTEDMIGDWVMDKMLIFVPEYDFFMYLTNADIMAGSISGDNRLILSFDNGFLYQVSEKLETRVPITRYISWANVMYFENPNPIVPVCHRFNAKFVPKNDASEFAGQLIIAPFPTPDEPSRIYIYLTFSQITSVDLEEGGE